MPLYANEKLGIIQGNQHGPYGWDKPFLPAKDLQIGDIVKCLVSRLSAGANWQKNTSKNHGWIIVSGHVSHILDNGRRRVTLNTTEVKKWEEPIGKERIESSVGAVGYPADHIIDILERE